MKKKFISLMIAAALLLGLGTSFRLAAESGDVAEAGRPYDAFADEEKPELKILTNYQSYDPEQQYSFELLQEMTGYKMSYFMLPQENDLQKLLLEISGGADYDMLYRMGFGGFSELSNNHALQDLAPYIEEYGANIKEGVSELAWQATINEDGEILGVPHEDMVASPEEPYGMFRGGIGFRTDLLEEVDGEIPKTLDEFTELLKKAKDVLGEAPLTGNSNSAFISPIMMAFGMESPQWYDIDGTYTHRIKHPGMRDYLAYMQMLYREGLIDVDLPINTNENARAKFASKNALALAPMMFWDIPSMLGAIKESNPDAGVKFLVGLAPDAETPGTAYIQVGAHMFTLVSQNAKHPEHVINWLNIISAPENYRRIYIGEEGISYKVEDGHYFPIFTEDEGDLDFNSYQNSDKFTGVLNYSGAFQMWQARARKTPEMAEAFEDMNSTVDEYKVLNNIEAYGMTSPVVQKNINACNMAFYDAFIKAIVEDQDPDEAMEAMRAEWDANGGLEIEDAMQQFYEEHK